MSPPLHRIVIALVGAGVSFATLNQIERYRATETPRGWTRIQGEALPLGTDRPRIGNSAWRLGPDTTWRTNEASEQLYTRMHLGEGATLGLSLSATDDQGTWAWFSQNKPISVTRSGAELSCLGQVLPPTEMEPIEIQAKADSLLISWGEAKMVCPGSIAPDDAAGGVPRIHTKGGPTQLISLGRDRLTDGQPLSPLWWMSGLMVFCLIWMLTFDGVVTLFRSIRPRPVSHEE